MKIYLAHSVHERERGQKIQAELEDLGFEVINPFTGEKERLGQIVEWDDLDPNSIKGKAVASNIILGDLAEVASVNMVVVIMPPDCVTIGIPCEMMFAWLIHKPCYTLVPKRLYGHPWICGLSTRVWVDTDERLMMMYLGGMLDAR